MKLTLIALAATTALMALAPNIASARSLGSLGGGQVITDTHGIGDVVTGPDPVIHPSDAVKNAIGDAVLGAGDGVDAANVKSGRALNSRLSIKVVLKCQVAGTPREFPDDLRIRNAGLDAIPAGTSLAWQVPAPHAAGSVDLAKALLPGETLKVNNVLRGGVEAGTACSVKAIGL